MATPRGTLIPTVHYDPESHGVNKAATEIASNTGIASSDELELAQLIVATLTLEVAAADIDPVAPLYREGLGLDSIDVLELALTISKTYGLQLRSDDENNLKIFGSLRSLNQHIQQHRTKGPLQNDLEQAKDSGA